MISEKEKLRFNRAKLSPRTKKIVTTALITLAVCAFFIWLGVGMYLSVPEEEREALLPMYFMYSVFPLLIIFFGAKRIYAVVNGKEDPDMSDCEVKEEIMIRPYEEKDWGSVEKIHDSARKVELSLAGRMLPSCRLKRRL